MEINELKNELKKGIVKFYYTKKDGSRRDAIGTTDINEVGKLNGYIPVGAPIMTKPNIVRYFDVERLDWRSFDSNLEFGIVNE